MKKRLLALSVGVVWAGTVTPAVAEDTERLARGKALFATDAVPACSICHALADAGAEGAIGPDLDELSPERDVVLKALKEGMGAMPSFAETMSEEDMAAVADYVVSATGK